MGKVIIVDKEKLKISALDHEKWLKEDKMGAILLRERDKHVEEALKKLKEGGR